MRRQSDLQPQQQIVGFHVEGQSPSPSPSSLLQESLRTISSGSPTPVIIPPQFQREASISRPESNATRSLGPEFAASDAAAGTQNILRTSSQIDQQQAALGVPVPAAAATAALPPPAPAAHSAGSAAAASQQRPPQQPAAAPGAAAAAADVDSSDSSNAQAAAKQAQQQPPPQQQQQQPPQQQPPQPAAASAPAEAAGAGAAPAGQPPPAKAPKPASKAERRALQEAQRAAKAAAKGGAGAAAAAGSGKGGAAADGGGSAAARPPKNSQAGAGTGGGQGAGSGRTSSSGHADSAAAAGAASARDAPRGGGSGGSGRGGAGGAGGAVLHSTELFAHLPQYRQTSIEGLLTAGRSDAAGVHPAVLALGLRYADGSITGSTARCVALVHALSQVIADYHTPEGKSLPRDLLATINAAVDFIVKCRPLSVSMGNAIKALKLYISKTDPTAPEAEAKAALLALMREWLQEKVAVADRVLVDHAVTKVYDGDVILTYAYSQVVLEVLLAAALRGRHFRVIVLDGRPELEGRQMLRRLLQANIPCSYVLLSGLSYIMREATKVMLGAAAVLSNGTVLSRAGSAAVAMTAHASSKPVLVCCEAFKFHERVQLDSITHNELGDPGVLAHVPPYSPAAAAPGAGPVDPVKGAPSQRLLGWHDSSRLALLNLKYDAMPAEYVTMVVTEFGMIPPSSVPVILREFSESAQLAE